MVSVGEDLRLDAYGRDCWLLSSVSEKSTWVMGIRWLPTVGPRSRKLLQRQLRDEKVRWWVCPTHRCATIGFLPTLDIQRNDIKESELLSAAMMFALTHPIGTHMLKVMFAPDFYWVVGVADGHVLSQTDCLLTSTEAVLDLQRGIQQRYADVVITEVAFESSMRMVQGLPFLLQHHLQSQVVLKKLGRCVSWTGWSIGLTVIAVISYFILTRNQVLPASTQEGRSVQEDTVLQQPAMIALSGSDLLSKIMQAWSVLPVQASGWQLFSAHCQLQMALAHCRVVYRRQSPLAVNPSLGFISALGWSMQAVTLDQTDFVRTVPVPVQFLSLTKFLEETLASAEKIESKRAWLVALQRLSSLTDAIEIGRSVAGIGALSVLAYSPVRIRLPMHALAAVEALRLPVVWKTLHLELRPLHLADETSRLRVLLEGDIVEKQ